MTIYNIGQKQQFLQNLLAVTFENVPRYRKTVLIEGEKRGFFQSELETYFPKLANNMLHRIELTCVVTDIVSYVWRKPPAAFDMTFSVKGTLFPSPLDLLDDTIPKLMPKPGERCRFNNLVEGLVSSELRNWIYELTDFNLCLLRSRIDLSSLVVPTALEIGSSSKLPALFTFCSWPYIYIPLGQVHGLMKDYPQYISG